MVQHGCSSPLQILLLLCHRCLQAAQRIGVCGRLGIQLELQSRQALLVGSGGRLGLQGSDGQRMVVADGAPVKRRR